MKNKITRHENHAVLEILNRKKEKVGEALIDLDDVDAVSKYAWSLGQNGYAQNTRSYHESGCRYLHQFILGRVEGKDIDHINMNKLDNRKCNLRHVTRKQNNHNNRAKGVCWDKSRNKWMAYIGKKTSLGRYNTFEEALEVRNKALEEVFNEQ